MEISRISTQLSGPVDWDISLVNVVASASIDQKIDLLDVIKVFRNARYNPKKFPGLVFRLKEPMTTTLIFRNGKMVCTGSKSEKIAHMAVNKVVSELFNKGIIIRCIPKIVIQNIVASVDLHRKIDLETAAAVLDNTMFEPEQFPGLIYRMQDPKTVLILFTSGKLVCTGAKSRDMVYESVAKMCDVLRDFDLFF